MICNIPKIKNLQNNTFFLIAGPCVIENKEITIEILENLILITDELKIPFIFKASYRKANRTKSSSFSGIDINEALEILSIISNKYKIPVLTDIHSVDEAKLVKDIVDVIQIPAFLCRQTDLLEAAAQTTKHINIKKGQFLSPYMMKFAAEKVTEMGNNNVLLTERGSFFGYNDIVVDMRNISIMKDFGFPVVFDATHSLQQPAKSDGITGGLPNLIKPMLFAALAAGADGLFIETHKNPQLALSDGANMLKLDLMKDILIKAQQIFRATK